MKKYEVEPFLPRRFNGMIIDGPVGPITLFNNQADLDAYLLNLSTGFWPIPKPPDTMPCLPPEPPAPVVKKTGHICTKCGDKNDFAEANQPDGTYQCSHHKRSLW